MSCDIAILVGTYPPRSVEDDLDYDVDWTDWLQLNETLTGATVETIIGDTVVSNVSHTSTKVIFWLSGGSAAITQQRLAIDITTSNARQRHVEAQIKVTP